VCIEDHAMTNLSEKIIDIYERRARDFDEDRARSDRFMEKAWLDLFIDALPKGGAVLDIGCGSGQPIARYLVGQGLEITGVDSSNAMIAMCRERFPDHSFHMGDMRALDLNATFDGLIAWDSFFHLTRDHQRRMFPIFSKHAKPSAALLFTSGHKEGVAIGALRDEALFHDSLSESEYRALLEENGFEVLKYTAQDPDCGLHTVWLGKKS